jgi:hypothetical protein
MVLGIDDGGERSMVSLHVQQDSGELGLEPGRTYLLVDRDPGPDAAGARIFVWRREGLIYFLAASSERAIEAARLALGAAEPTESI